MDLNWYITSNNEKKNTSNNSNNKNNKKNKVWRKYLPSYRDSHSNAIHNFMNVEKKYNKFWASGGEKHIGA